MGRGATNQKGPERALLNAISSILAVEGRLPVNLMVAAEGEEELGSPHYPQIVDAYEARLREADGVIFPFNSQDQAGDFEMSLGVKGILYVEMEAKGGPHGGPVNAEIHGSYKAVVDAPALRLTHAIASLTSPDGNTILVPGYYDAVRRARAQRVHRDPARRRIGHRGARRDREGPCRPALRAGGERTELRSQPA
jgi:acetylornithine deacetylase/succinyl-diaminopimelate desuccinylase-like protein